MHPLTIQSGLLTGWGSPSPSHKGGRWEVGRRVLCRGLASRHGTRGWPLGPPRGMRSASVPNRLRLLDHAAGQERRKFKFKMSSSVRLVFSFQARAPCPTGCSIRNFAFNTAERTSFVEQMRSDRRDIGSVQFKDLSRGFFMAYFEHISQKDNSQAQGSVVKTMISKQICL